MKNLIVIFTFVLLSPLAALAQSTAFTFQGRLNDGTVAATGNVQLEIKLFDALAGGAQIGSTVNIPSVPLVNGVFSTELDFGATAFDGSARFLQIGVRPAGTTNPYTILSPRQHLSSVPYSIKSRSSDTATNALSLGGLDPTNFVRYDANGDVAIGTTSTGSKLTVGGVIETTKGGIKYPDATIQASAGLTAVATNPTLTGNGTSALPLGIGSPLMVRDLDNPARQPFRIITTVNNAILVNVPKGKRLVVEFISGFMQINSFSNVSGLPAILLKVNQSGTLVFQHEIAPQLVYSVTGGTVYIMSQELRMYVDAGDELQASFPSGSGLLANRVSVTGYFVDVP